MSGPELRQMPRPMADPGAAPPRPRALPDWRDGDREFAFHLLRTQRIEPHDLVQCLAQHDARQASLPDSLLANGCARDPALTRALAEHARITFIDPLVDPPDARLIDRIGAATCLRDSILPWRRIGDATLVLLPRPELFLRHGPLLEATFGAVIPGLAPRAAIQAAVQAARSEPLRLAAEARVPAAESCRGWSAAPARSLLIALSLSLCAILAPTTALSLLTAVALLSLVLSMGLKGAALLAASRAPAAESPPPVIARLPIVSAMVALYHESDIAPRLVQRLGRLDYPRELLDILLVVEEDDTCTRAALDRPDLPPWMRIVVVPHGALRTKPRALNFALEFCRGSIVGVYDAEDAPEPDQIRRVVDSFHRRGAEVACLQGVLDFYNPATNWLSRCFTIEYAAWFRIVLPGLQRLGLPIPLGGTTLFFRRAALESLGGWDAHNVTEDADLGVRLCRHGYRTELIDSVTREEANCSTMHGWVKQRSRWIKGYMMTWAVHMRDPRLLWRQLGPRGFAGFQVLFLGSLTQSLLAPLLLSYWAVTFGQPHPVAAAMPPVVFFAMVGLFILCEGLNIAIGLLALRRTRHRLSRLWVPTLHFYHPLAALAAYKALWELVLRPFYWDKTHHGQHDAASGA